MPKSSEHSSDNQRRRDSVNQQPRRQGLYWIATIRENDWEPHLPDGVAYCRGQLECGAGGFRHYQVLFTFTSKKSLRAVRTVLPATGHYELSRCSAANDYVWKTDTRIGEPFEFGHKPIQRNSMESWDQVRSLAQSGDLQSIPSDIFVRYYNNLNRISADFVQPLAVVRTCSVFWGKTGTGKSRSAWDRAGDDVYSKDPRTKFWCGYRGQRTVVIDEFRGGIDVAHLLRWLDRYPVRVERKGGSYPLMADTFYITSNLHPKDWYPELDLETYNALHRRLNITQFHYLLVFNCSQQEQMQNS